MRYENKVKNMKTTISTEKLIHLLKQSKVDTAGIDNDSRYMYATGRNTLADMLLVSIYCGDLSEE
jgi:hypothetical protein